MTIDVGGFIEVKKKEKWCAEVNLCPMNLRNRLMSGLFFDFF